MRYGYRKKNLERKVRIDILNKKLEVEMKGKFIINEDG